MRLHQDKIEVESTEAIASQTFGIREQDMSFVIDVLRKKMYQNPIRAFVREISCNARDAHREIGEPNKPIEITLPTLFEKQISIKDEGPGINPRRMSEIFLNYGASTKRNTNVLNGAFGLGSKTPLALGDQFSVITIHGGMKRFYTAVIDESRMGRMDLIREVHTDEHTGTTIIVPVKESDFNNFAKSVIDETTHWNSKHNSGVRPIIHNLPASVIYPADKKIMLEGEGWELYYPNKNNHGYGDKLTIIIDGIAYTVSDLDLDLSYHNEKHNNLRSILTKNINIYFGIGKLSLASNRDNIHFDDKTKIAIIEKLKSVISQIAKMGAEKASSEPSLDKAEVFWNSFNEYVSFSKSVETPIWNGYELQGTMRTIGNTNAVINNYGYRVTKNSNKTFSRSSVDRIHFSDRLKIFIQDEDNSYAVAKRINKYIDENSEIKSACVISFQDAASKTYWMDRHGLKHVPTLLVSSLPEHVKEHKPITPREKAEIIREKKDQLDVWQFVYRGHNKNNWDHIILEDKSIGGIFVEAKNKKTNEYSCGNIRFSNDHFNDIQKLLGVQIYAIKSESIPKLNQNWKRLEDVLVPRIQNELASFSESDIERAEELRYNTFSHVFERKLGLSKDKMSGLISYILDSESLVLKYIKESSIVENYLTSSHHSRNIQNKFGYLISDDIKPKVQTLKDSKIVDLQLDVIIKYPLLNQLNIYNANSIVSICEYINLIDEKYNQQNIKVA